MLRMRLLAFLLFAGSVAGFGSGFAHLARGGGGWQGHHCERAASEAAP